MNKFLKLVVLIASVVVLVSFDEYFAFPAILDNVPSPFNYIVVLVLSGGEIFGLFKEAEALF
jgi:hypothetical protein